MDTNKTFNAYKILIKARKGFISLVFVSVSGAVKLNSCTSLVLISRFFFQFGMITTDIVFIAIIKICAMKTLLNSLWAGLIWFHWIGFGTYWYFQQEIKLVNEVVYGKIRAKSNRATYWSIGLLPHSISCNDVRKRVLIHILIY